MRLPMHCVPPAGFDLRGGALYKTLRPAVATIAATLSWARLTPI